MLVTESLKTVIFNSFADIESIWRSFEETGDNYAFQSFNFLKQWHDSVDIVTNCQACLVVVKYPLDQPIMILPLGIEKRHGIRCLVWLGGEVADYHGPLLSPDYSKKLPAALFQQAWRIIQAQLPAFDSIVFEEMPQTIGGQLNPFVSLPCIPTASSAHFTDLGTDFNAFLTQKRSKKSLDTEKRKHKRLREFGQVEFVIATHSTQTKRFLADMISQKVRSYMEMGVSNLFASKEVCDFFAALSLQLYPSGMVHMSALTLDDRVIATHWGLVYKKRFYHLYPTYEQSELTRYAPGGLLMWKLFEWCIDNGIETYDFTIGDEAYKTQWCNHELNLYNYYHGTTVLGKTYTVFSVAYHRLKRKVKHTPKLWERVQTMRSWLAKISLINH